VDTLPFPIQKRSLRPLCPVASPPKKLFFFFFYLSWQDLFLLLLLREIFPLFFFSLFSPEEDFGGSLFVPLRPIGFPFFFPLFRRVSHILIFFSWQPGLWQEWFAFFFMIVDIMRMYTSLPFRRNGLSPASFSFSLFSLFSEFNEGTSSNLVEPFQRASFLFLLPLHDDIFV